MREIKTHHDNHGLNESLQIITDDAGPGGASHHYRVVFLDGKDEGGLSIAAIQFQKGPRAVAGSETGITEAVLLAILQDRLVAFQSGEYACEENQFALDAVREAMLWVKKRADNRAARGVLGTYAK